MSLVTEYDELRVRIAVDQGRPDAVVNFTAEDTTRIDRAVKSGLNMFFSPDLVLGEKFQHDWSFLKPLRTLTTSAPYSTGTIAISSGTVTLTGGTWPSDAAQGQVSVSGGVYEVVTRDSGTQLTIAETTVTVAAGTSYVLQYSTYDLPSDFAEITGPITYASSQGTFPKPLEEVSDAQIRDMKSSVDYTSWPQVFALRLNGDPDRLNAEQKWQIVFDPTPDKVYYLKYESYINPSMLDATNKYALAGRQHAETINAACLAAADRDFNGVTNSAHWNRFKELLAASVRADKKQSAPDRLGYNGNGHLPRRNTWNYGRRYSQDNLILRQGFDY